MRATVTQNQLVAGRLELAGLVDPDAFLALMAGHDPATGRDLGRRYGEGSVRGYDAGALVASWPGAGDAVRAPGNPLGLR